MVVNLEWFPGVLLFIICTQSVSRSVIMSDFWDPMNWSPSSFCIPRTNLPVTPGVSWLPTFAFQSPIMKRTSFFVLVLEGLVGLQRTIQLQLLQHYWLGHRLGLLSILNGLPWKRTEIIQLFLRQHPSTAFRTPLLTMMPTPFLQKDSRPQ